MKVRKRTIIIFIVLILLTFVASIIFYDPGPKQETIKQVMLDAVLHEENKIEILGVLSVNPGFVSALLNTGLILFVGALIRIFVVPKFTDVPGRFQLVLETIVGYFYDLAKKHSPERYHVLGAYTFGAGVYIFLSTIFELFGIQAVTSQGLSISLPAPISDINAAISMGFLSYLFILYGGLTSNGFRGVGKALKDFSLPISMSFRLFGALLGGLLVNELVYYYLPLSYVLPIVVAVLFTLIHALVQSYVLTLLTSIFFGEVTEKHELTPKRQKVKQQESLT